MPSADRLTSSARYLLVVASCDITSGAPDLVLADHDVLGELLVAINEIADLDDSEREDLDEDVQALNVGETLRLTYTDADTVITYALVTRRH